MAASRSQPPSRFIQGVTVSSGLVAGPVHIVQAGADEVPTWTVSAEDVPAEIGRLAAAMNAAGEELSAKQEQVAAQTNGKDAEIFAVHRMILTDPSALQEVEVTISEERVNAEAAVERLIKRFESTLGSLEGASVRGYAADVSDPWRLVLGKLLERDSEQVRRSVDRVVLIAPELTPQVTTFLPKDRVLAIVCEKGGRFSHGAVLARSLGVPCVVAIPNLLARLEQDRVICVNGDQGTVLLNPAASDLKEFAEEQEQRAARRAVRESVAAEAPTTTDGERLDVQVNIESVRDLETFQAAHTDGVGLLRTEFLYMERSEFPSEEEQYRMYRRVVEHMQGQRVTVRTLDIGADKQLPYFNAPEERNPALGWRGLRISLQWPDLFRVQLRAALRAGAHGPLQLLLPMVSSLEQIDEAHEIFNGVRESLEGQGYDVPTDLPVGAMIEVPSLLLNLEDVVEEVDFVSVGTNDLVQYLLAVDRDNSFVTRLYEPHDPSVIKALERVAKVAGAAGKPCSVCGDVAANPAVAACLLGLGFTSVSVSPHFVPDIKYALRQMSGAQARMWAEELVACRRGVEVKQLLRRVSAELHV